MTETRTGTMLNSCIVDQLRILDSGQLLTELGWKNPGMMSAIAQMVWNAVDTSRVLTDRLHGEGIILDSEERMSLEEVQNMFQKTGSLILAGLDQSHKHAQEQLQKLEKKRKKNSAEREEAAQWQKGLEELGVQRERGKVCLEQGDNRKKLLRDLLPLQFETVLELVKMMETHCDGLEICLALTTSCDAAVCTFESIYRQSRPKRIPLPHSRDFLPVDSVFDSLLKACSQIADWSLSRAGKNIEKLKRLDSASARPWTQAEDEQAVLAEETLDAHSRLRKSSEELLDLRSTALEREAEELKTTCDELRLRLAKQVLAHKM